MVKIKYHPDASQDYQEATQSYNKHDGSRGRFSKEISWALNQINQSPTRYRSVEGDVRRFLCPVFPYGILYSIEPDAIFVIAVMHLHRSPDYWRYRI